MELTAKQQAMLAGNHGAAKQMAMRLLVDLGTAADAPQMVPVAAAHVSGVSPLTGGHGLTTFLERLGDDAQVAVETTLNSAGCDSRCWREMGATTDYVERQQRILDAYAALGVRLTLSCTPYEAVQTSLPDGVGAWAESNAVCYANSYTELRTNRDSGLSALAAAICGCTPDYGLLRDENRTANLLVEVECDLVEPVDFSVLGDWVGKQLPTGLALPWGPVPHFRGVSEANHEARKALSAAAANYGCALLYLDEPPAAEYQATLCFTAADLKARYAELAPRHAVDLVVIGCPQASPAEVRATAELVRSRSLPEGRLWVFTASRHWDSLHEEVATIEAAGGMVLRDTCPEVVHYDRASVNHILTNSLKAEHYLQSGLNSMPTSVARLADSIAHAANPEMANGVAHKSGGSSVIAHHSPKVPQAGALSLVGSGLESQDTWMVEGEALVTDVPLTFLGFVNRRTGVVEEPGHPLDGQSIAGKVLVFPRGSGSSVAPYVLLGLLYRNHGPLAVVNTELDQQTLPACSLLGVPYTHSFGSDPCLELNSGDQVRLELRDGTVTLELLERAPVAS
ncbi:MAG: aconitase X [Candidatus Poseidoniia archaeon]|nr:aconitase X [Candidatus Poseidoniia archaeon]